MPNEPLSPACKALSVFQREREEAREAFMRALERVDAQHSSALTAARAKIREAVEEAEAATADYKGILDHLRRALEHGEGE